MGVVADFETVFADRWPLVLARIVEAGIRIDERGEGDGLLWCSCRRGRASLGLALETSKSAENVTLHCGALHYWTRPASTRKLFREVRSAVRSAARGADA